MHIYAYGYTHVCTYVTGFWKTDQIVTLGLFHFIGPANSYSHTLHIHTAIIRLVWLVCFSRATFADPVNSWLGQWDPWRALHGRHGCEIHPRDRDTSIMPFEHVWAYGWHFWDPWLVQTVLTDGLALLRLPTHPLHPPSPSHLPTPYNMPSMILERFWKKLLKIQQC